MDAEVSAALGRIADALERRAPEAAMADFAGANLFRHDATSTYATRLHLAVADRDDRALR